MEAPPIQAPDLGIVREMAGTSPSLHLAMTPAVRICLMVTLPGT